MEKFRPGKIVFYVIDGQIHYRRIKSIVQTEDGVRALFDEGCVKNAIKVPLDQVFTTKEELESYLKGE